MAGELDAEFDALPDATALDNEFDSLPDAAPGPAAPAQAAAPQPPAPQPQPSLWDKASNLVSRGVSWAQEDARQGLEQTFGGNGPGMVKVAAARLQQLNPFANSAAANAEFEKPAALQAARDMHQTSLGLVKGLVPQAKPAGLEKGADVVDTAAQAIPGIGGNFLPLAGGVSVSAKVAPLLGPAYRAFPKLSGLFVGTAEQVLQNTAMQAASAEEGKRLAVINDLAKPIENWQDAATRVALPLLGGGMAGLHAGGTRRGELVKEFAGPSKEAVAANAALAPEAATAAKAIADRAAQPPKKVLAVVSADHVRALADEAERNAALAKGELLLQDPDATQPLPRSINAEQTSAGSEKEPYSWLAHNKGDAPEVGGIKSGAHYQFEKTPSEADMSFTAEGGGLGVREDPNINFTAEREGKALPLTPRDVRSERAQRGALKRKLTTGLAFKGPTGEEAQAAVAKSIARNRNLPRQYDLPENPFEYGGRPEGLDEIANRSMRQWQEDYATAELARGANPNQLAREQVLRDRADEAWRQAHPMDAAENGPNDPLGIPLSNLANIAAKHRNSPFSPFRKLHPETKRDVLSVSQGDPKWAKEVKKGLRTRRIIQQASVVASDHSATGLAGVIEHGNGKVEVQEIENVQDAQNWRAEVAKADHQPDVSFSTRAVDRLAKTPTMELHDSLTFSPDELAAGKSTGGHVENRAAAVMSYAPQGGMATEIPYLTSITDPEVRATAARNNILAVKTKDGVAFVHIMGTGHRDGNPVITQLPKEHGLPTINEQYVQLDRNQLGVNGSARPLTQSEWVTYFKTGKVPESVRTAPVVNLTRQGEPLQVRREVPVVKFEKATPAGTKPERAVSAPEPAMPLSEPVMAGGPQLSEHAQGLMRLAGSGGPGGGGKPPPPPKGPPTPPPSWGPGDLPIKHDVVSEGMAQVIRGAMGMVDPNNASIWQRLRRGLIGMHHNGSIDFQTTMMQKKGADELMTMKDRILASIQRASPNAPRGNLDFHADSIKLGDGRMTTDQFIAKYPAGREAKAIYDELSASNTATEARLINEFQMLNPKAETLAESPQYLTRLTLAYMVGGKKAVALAKARTNAEGTNVWKAAIEGVKSSAQEKGNIINDVDAEVYLHSLMGGDDTVLHSFTLPGSSNAKARQNLPPWLRDVLGQDLSGELAMAYTYGVQQAALQRGIIFREIAQHPEWVNRDAQVLANAIGTLPKQMPNNRWLYGDLANQYVHPHVFDVTVPDSKAGTLASKFSNLASQPNAIYSALRSVSHFWKGNVISNPTPIVNSFVGNWYHMVLAGVSPAEFPRYGQNMEWAARAMLDFRKDPIASESGGNLGFLIRDARKAGFDAEGFGATEISRAEVSKIQETFLRAVADAGGHDPYGRLVAGFKAVAAAPFKGAMSVNEKFGHVLDLTDRLHKVAAGYTLAEQAMRRAGLTEPGLVQKVTGPNEQLANEIKTRDDALAWAARRVNRAFPMPDRIGLVPRYTADAAGMALPFSTYMSEVLRTSAQAFGTVAEDPRVAVSMAAWLAVANGVAQIAKMRNPVDQKLIEESKKRRRLNPGTYEPNVVSTYLTDKNGEPVLADLTPMFDISRYLAGDRTMPTGERVAGNFALALSDRGLFSPLVKDGLEALDPRWEQYDRKQKVWQAGWANAANRFLMETGAAPAWVTKPWKLYQQTQPQPFNPYSTNMQQPGMISLMQGAGLPVMKQQNPLASALQVPQQMGQVKRDIKSRLMEPNGYGTGPLPTQNPVGEDIQSIIDLRTRQK